MNQPFLYVLENLKKDPRRWSKIEGELSHSIHALYAGRNFLKVKDLIEYVKGHSYKYKILSQFDQRALTYLIASVLPDRSWSLWSSEKTRFSRNGVWVRLGL